jgi:SAM-dependent methyltransferase
MKRQKRTTVLYCTLQSLDPPFTVDRTVLYSAYNFTTSYMLRGVRLQTLKSALHSTTRVMASSSSVRLESPAAERNKGPILEELQRVVRSRTPPAARVLLVAEGGGVHCNHFVLNEASLVLQPTDVSSAALRSIESYREALPKHARDRVLPAMELDVLQDAQWAALGTGNWDVVMAINLIHISPPACTDALLEGASRALRPGGALMLYGPFLIDGKPTTDSNAAFDATLKAMNPTFGIRDLAAVTDAARARALELTSKTPMPSNNFTLTFIKRTQAVRGVEAEQPPSS